MGLKKIAKRILDLFQIEIKRKNKEVFQDLSFDDIYKKKITRNPIIFDVGANQGQSIERFKKIFKSPIIHAFEPVEFEFKKLKEKYSKDKNIILNNYAVGEKKESKCLYITAKTGTSSFNKVKNNTDWLKKRSQQNNTTLDGYTKSKETVKVITLDSYCLEKNITQIDILKIDTQGYEDMVLKGCQDILSKKIISIVESELMFDNVYEKYLTFTDLEKYLLPNNFRLVGLNLTNSNLFSGLVFFADVMYFNKDKFKL